MTRRFHNYLAVDWSASSVAKTGPNSICYYMHSGRGHRAANPATRREAEAAIRQLLIEAVRRGEATLCGFDFALGYPAGFARALGVGEPPWHGVWRAIAAAVQDAEDNANNRFAVAGKWNRRLGSGPFWGCPRGASIAGLGARKPTPDTHGFADLRLCEKRIRGVQSVWKLYGAGSVGSQTLMGIPCLERLRSDPALRGAVRVWPFETGLECPAEPGVVFAEVYPSMLSGRSRKGEFRDETQVRTLACYFARLDERGALEGLFRGDAGLSEVEREVVVREEGWVLT